MVKMLIEPQARRGGREQTGQQAKSNSTNFDFHAVGIGEF
jgi:hypothetical protein